MANLKVFVETLGQLDEIEAGRRQYSHIVFAQFLLLPHLHLQLGDATLSGIV